MARTAKPAEFKPPAAPSQPVVSRKKSARSARGSEGQLSGRYALAKGPLGIVLAGLILIETIMGLVVRSEHPPANVNFVIYAMVALAFATLFGFFIVWIWFPGYLYPPSQFRDERIWLTAVMREDILPSEPLPIPSIVHVDHPAEGAELRLQVGEIAVDVAPVLATPEGSITGKSAEAWQPNWVTGELQGGEVSSTVVMELSKHLQGSSDWDYLTVDVGRGNTWLLSRLFIFVSLYRAVRNLPCIVFVQTEAGIKRLLGIADPVKVCSVLASLYPWFNEIFASVLTERKIPIFMSGAIDEGAAIDVMTEFVQRLKTPDNHSGDPEWSKLASGWWEHTRWLNSEMVRKDLSSALFEPKAAFFRRPDGMSDQDFAIEIIGRDSRFVALVGDQGEFRQLYDKRRIFDRVKQRLQAA